jgi:cell division protein FtsW
LLLGVAVGLTLFGLAMIASVSVYQSFTLTTRLVEKGILDEPTNAFYLYRHLTYVLGGMVVLFLFTVIPYRVWERLSLPLYVGSLLLTLSVFLPGIGAEYGTSRSWINVMGFSLQPIEILKLALIVYLAVWLQKREQAILTFHGGFLPFVTLLSLSVLLIALQPDFGGVIVLGSIASVMFYLAGGRISYLLLGAVVALLIAFPLILSEDYVRSRFMAFLNPSDPTIAETSGFQIQQALIAIGSGRLFGVGYGKSIQKFGYLPEVQSDTIFAAMGEELGFFRLLIILSLYSILIHRAFQISRQAPDRFSILVAAGIASGIGVQTLVNIAVNLSLLPLTGITLPLLSYGGSSLWMTLASIGILLNISSTTSHDQIASRRRRLHWPHFPLPRRRA